MSQVAVMAALMTLQGAEGAWNVCGTSGAACTGFFTFRYCTNGRVTGPEQRCKNLLICDENQGPSRLPCKFIGGR